MFVIDEEASIKFRKQIYRIKDEKPKQIECILKKIEKLEYTLNIYKKLIKAIDNSCYILVEEPFDLATGL